jgi:predicted nucleotidyltransferase
MARTNSSIEQILKLTRSQFPNARLIFFGSQVDSQKKVRCDSDFDILIDNGQPLTLLELSALREVFQESDLPFFVDFHCYHSVPEHFKKNAESRGMIY